MRRALELARLGLAGAWPNPMVGAVVVRDGRVIGEGHHAEHGGAHAEVAALTAAGDATGATLYVTLEPCSHHGRTPPCTDAVISAGIRRVVFAATDPNPRAAGGAARLREAGIATEGGVEADEARRLNAAFFQVHEQGTTFVALKLAVSLDGGIAAAAGQRTQLTGRAAQLHVHQLRAAHDAVMVGIGTARIDDPLLTVRDLPVRRQPVRVVIDSAAALDPASRLVASVADAPVLLVCGDDVPGGRLDTLNNAGVTVLQAPRNDGGVDMQWTFRELRDHGIRSVLVEGGACLAGTLLRHRMLHRMYLMVAPVFLGAGAVPAFPGALADPAGWQCIRTERLGDDALLTLDPAGAA